MWFSASFLDSLCLDLVVGNLPLASEEKVISTAVIFRVSVPYSK